jgi:DNA-binding beta-propeller fold protein YncE
LPAGDVKITAKVIQNPAYGYFATSSDFSTFNINRIRLTDNVINPGGGGWPVASTTPIMALSPSPVSSLFYTGAGGISSGVPAQFDSQNPANPTPVSGSYPANVSPNVGAFSANGEKFYVPNINGNQISVLNASTNTWIKDIDTQPTGSITVWRSPQSSNKVYAAGKDGTVRIINTDTDEVIKSIPIPCDPLQDIIVTTIGFSADPNYPYYYVPCTSDGTIVKLRLSDDSVITEFNTGSNPVTLGLSPDNRRIFISNLVGSSDSDKMKVINSETGDVIQSIQLTSGAFGFIATPDFQKIYISTPGNLQDVFAQNINVINTETYAVEEVATSGLPTVVTYSAEEVANADVDVSFVLGASTTTGSETNNLAETGAVAVSTILLLGLIIGSTTYLYVDYRKHKRPLVQEDPHVRYTFAHHIKTVSIPLFKYRLRLSISKTG